MSKVILQFICLTIFCISICSTASAQVEYVGGDIGYEKLSANNYKVTLKVNRRCSGDNFLSQASIIVSDELGGLCLIPNASSVALNLDSLRNISPICNTATSSCGGGFGTVDSIEQASYSGIINVNSLLGLTCNNTRISFQNNGRDPNSGTIQTGEDFYISTIIYARNDASLPNKTPVFGNESLLYINSNSTGNFDTITYSHIANDFEGDSLVYSLVDCQEGFNNPVEYLALYSGINPMNNNFSFSMNPVDGEIKFVPKTVQQATICVLVEEYRGNVKVGETTRNIEVIMNNDINKYPRILPTPQLGNASRKANVCATGTYSFDIQGFDADASNAIDLEAFDLPPGATLTKTLNGNTLQASITWTPTVGQIGNTYTFVLKVTDDNCPLQGFNSYTYELKVLAPIQLQTIVGDVSCVGDNTGFVSAALSGGTTPYSYSWTGGQMTSTINNLISGLYRVTATDANGCYIEETAFVNEPFVSGSIYSEERVATVVQGNWTFPNLANSSNNIYAGANTTDTDEIWSTFQFNRANTDDIVGIEVSIEGNDNNSGAGVAVDLFHPTSGTFSNMGYNVTFNSNVDQTITFGSPADRWGYTWNATTDINQAGFQVRLTKIGAGIVEIDEIRVKVYYVDNTPYTFLTDSVQTGNTITLLGDRVLTGGVFSSPTPSVDNGISGNVFDATGVVSGSYAIAYTGNDAAGCTVTETAQMRVVAPFDCGVIRSNSPVCEGETIRIEDTLRAHTPGVTSWQIREPGSSTFGPTTIYEHLVPNSDAITNSGVYVVRVNAGAVYNCPVFVEVVQPQYSASATPFNFASGSNGFWTNFNNAEADDNQFATGPPGTQMQLNTFSLPGFSIPANAVILGIEVEVEAAKGGPNDGDLQIRLRSGASPFSRVGVQRFTSATPNTDTLGTPNFLWGRSWTPAEINSGLVVELSTPNTNTSTIEVDYAAVRVHYNIPPDIGIPNLTTYTQPNVIDLVASGPPIPNGGTYSSQLAPTAITGGTFFDTRLVTAGIYDLNYGFVDGNGCIDSSTILLRVQSGYSCANVPNRVSGCVGNTIVLRDTNSTSTSWTWQNNVGTIVGTNNDSLILSNVGLANAGLYLVDISDGGTTLTCPVRVDIDSAKLIQTGSVFVLPSDDSGQWDDANQAFGPGFASERTNNEQAEWDNFFGALSANDEVVGFELRLTARNRDVNFTTGVQIEVSLDGTNYSPVSDTAFWNNSPAIFSTKTRGGCNTLWGFTSADWTATMNTNAADFKVRLTKLGSPGRALDLDVLEAKLHLRDKLNFNLNATILEGDTLALRDSLVVANATGVLSNASLSTIVNDTLFSMIGDAGVHPISYTLPSNCQACDALIGIGTVTVLPRPSSLCGNVDSNAAVCDNSTLVLEDSLPTSNTMWQWEKPLGNILANTRAYSIANTSPLDSGIYYLIVSDGNITDTCTVDVTINEPVGKEDSTVYLNSSQIHFNNGWIDPGNTQNAGLGHANSTNNGNTLLLKGFNATPVNNRELVGIQVKVTGRSPGAVATVGIDLSADGGTTFSPVQESAFFPPLGPFTERVVGSDRSLWGFSSAYWQTNLASNIGGNFILRLTDITTTVGNLNIDHVQVKFYYKDSVDYTLPTTTYFDGDTEDLNLIPVHPTGGSFQSATLSSLSGGILTLTPVDIGTHVLTYGYTDKNGCFGGQDQTITVQARPSTLCGAVSNDTAICRGGNVVLMDANTTGSRLWDWQKPLGTPIPNNTSSLTVNNALPLAEGRYYLIVTEGSITDTCEIDLLVNKPRSQPGTASSVPPYTIPNNSDWIARNKTVQSDNDYAHVGASGETMEISGLNFGAIPPNAEILGVEVLVEGYLTNNLAELDVEFITGGSTSFNSSVKKRRWRQSGVEDIVILGSPNDLWGLSPTSIDGSSFDNAFQLDITSVGIPLGDSIYVDYVQVRVHYNIPPDIGITPFTTYTQPQVVELLDSIPSPPFSAGHFYSSTSYPTAISVTELITNNVTGAPTPMDIAYNVPDTNGCLDIDVVQVSIQRPPTLTCSGVIGAGNYCVGDTIIITDTGNPSSLIQELELIGPSPFNTFITNNLDTFVQFVATTSSPSGLYALSIVDNNIIPNSIVCPVNININTPPPATIYAEEDTICQRDRLRLFTDANPNYNYTWESPSGVIYNTDTVRIATVVLNDGGIYTLNIEDNTTGCSVDTFIEIIVNPLPNIPSIDPTTLSVCDGNPLNLNLTTLLGSTDTVKWQFNGGFEVINPAGISSLTINPVDPNLYKTGIVRAEVFSDQGCSRPSAPRFVEIKPTPVADISNAPNLICYGDTAILEANRISGAIYTWYDDPDTTNIANIIQTGTSAQLILNNLINTTTVYLAVEVNGCRSGVDNHTINVDAAPYHPAIANNNIVACQGDDIILATTEPGNSYTWVFPLLGQSNNRVVRLNNVQPAMSGRYILQMTNTVGCPLLDTFIDVTVTPRPGVFNLGIDTICQGDTLELIVSGANLNAGDVVEWYSPDGVLQATTTDTILLVQPTNATAYQSGYWEAVIVVGGCRSLPQRRNAVFVQPPVSQGITVNNPVCIGDDVLLGTPPRPNIRFQWFDDRVNVPFATGTTALIPNIAQSDTIYLVLNELPTRKCATVDSVIVEVRTPAVTTITFTDSLCEGDSIIVDIAPAGSSQQWTHVSNGFSTANPDFVITPATLIDSGKYYINYVDTNGCSYEDSINITINAPTIGTITTASTPICDGDLLQLEVTAPLGTLITWEAPDGTTINSANISAPPFSVAYQEGLWIAEILDVNTGCRYFVDTFITIYDRPAAPFITLDTPQCAGADIQVTTSFIPDVIRYNWLDSIGQLVALGQNPVLTGMTVDTTIYLDVQTIDGCFYRLDSVSIQPRANTIPTSLFSSDTLLVCGDGSIVTFNNVKNPNFAYFWTSPDGSTSTDTMPFATASSFYEGWYYLEIEDITTTCTREDSLYLALSAATSPGDNVVLTSSPCLGQPLSVQYIPVGITQSGVIYEFTFYDNSLNPLAIDTSGSTELLIGTAVSYYDTLVNLNQVWVTIIDTTTICRSNPAFSGSINLITAAPPIPTQPNPVCLGDSVLLGVQVETGYSYVWYDDAALTSSVDSNAFFYAQNITSTDTFYVQATSPQGCLSDSFVVVNVVANPLPPIVVGDTVCIGDSILVYTTTPGSSFQWTDGGSFVTNDSVFVITPARPVNKGNYTLTMRDTNGCLLPTVTTFVEVYNNPPVPTVVGNTNACLGDTIVLNRIFSVASVEWYDAVADTLINTGDSLVLVPSDSFYRQGNSTIRVVQTNLNGCSEETTITINISPLTVAGYTGDTVVCAGDDATIRGTAFATYTWYESPGATTALATGISYQLDSLLSDTFIYYTAQAPFGCLSDTIAVPIRVNILPALPNISNDTSVCATNIVQLSTNTTAGVINYQWSGPNNFISNQQNPILNSVDTGDAGIYSLYIIDTNQCASDSAFVLLTIDTLPTAPTTAPVIILCQRDTLFLVADGTSDCDVVEWVGPTGTNILLGDSVAISFTDTANYKGGIWRANCIDTATGCFSQSNGNLVVILPGPDTPQVSIVAPPCLGGAVELIVNTPPASYSYTWYADSNLTQIVANGANPTIGGINQDTIFYVVATDGLSCTSLPTSIFVSPIQLGAPNIQPDIEVCEGSDATLIFNGVGNRYQWTGPNGFSTYDSVFVLSSVSVLDTGIYTFSLIDTNGCQLQDTSLRLIVNPNPVRPLIGGDSMLCDGETVVLYTTNQAVLPITSRLEWSNVGIGGLFLIDTLSFNSATGGPFYNTGDWFVVVRDTLTGCTDTSAPYTVQINPVPTTSITSTGTACSGSNVSFEPTTIQAGANYIWYSTDTLVALDTGTVFTINNLTTDTIVVLEIEQNGCVSYAVDTFNITNTGVIPSILPISTPCEGEDVLVGTTTSGSRYEWRDPSGNFVTYDSAFVIRNISLVDTGTYELLFTDSAGCQSTVVSVSVGMNFLPILPAVVGNDSICDGEDILLYTTAISTTDSLSWIFDSSPTVINTDTVLIDPSITTLYQSGAWSAVVTNTLTGCADTVAPYTVQINTIPTTSITHNTVNCGGGNITFQPTQVQAGATYTWYEADSTTQIAIGTQFTIPNLTTDTIVVLEIEQNGCVGYAIDTINITTNGIAPVLLPASIVCEGDDATIGTTSFGTSYEWIDPSGNFVTYDSAFVLTNVSILDTGAYTLQFVDSTGCTAQPVTVRLDVNPAPALPIIIGDTAVCDGETINLTVNLAAGDSVRWINSSNISTIPFTTNTFSIDTSTAFFYQTGTIQALITAAGTGCTSISSPYAITINSLPNVTATGNGPFCGTTNAVFEPATIQSGANYTWLNLDSVVLNTGAVYTINNLATDTTLVLLIEQNGCINTDTLINTFNIPVTPVVVGTTIGCEGQDISFGTNTYGIDYEWTGPTGFLTYDSILTITNLNASDTGNYELRFVDSAGCQSPSITVAISMLAAPPIPNILGSTTICDGDTINLGHNGGSTYSTTWVSGSTIVTAPKLTILPNTANYNNTDWTLVLTDTATGCTSSQDTTIVKQTAPIALISNNGPVCAGADAVFTAANIAGASYAWYQSGQLVGVGNNIVVNNVNTTTIVMLEVSSAIGCTNTSMDSVEVDQGAVSLVANNDTVSVVAGASSTIVDVIANDSLGGAWSIQVLDPLNQAISTNLNNGSFDLDFTGVNTSDEFTYEICNPACNAACDTAVVFINVELLGDCMIPNIFTPNGDNVNDVFEIPCLSGTGNKIWIFNRWGDLIYETDNYLNNWDGTHNGMTVPDGTYFYILKTSSGEEKQSSIEVRR